MSLVTLPASMAAANWISEKVVENRSDRIGSLSEGRVERVSHGLGVASVIETLLWYAEVGIIVTNQRLTKGCCGS